MAKRLAKSTVKFGSAVLVNVPPGPLSLPEKSHVRVTIETSDTEREEWLNLSEESLKKVWDNDADDVFNELLEK